MGTYFKAIDRFAALLTRRVIAHRGLVLLGAVIVAVLIGSGARHLEFSTNYRVFFSEANPELQAFEELQNTYTKNDNFFFVVEPKQGEAFEAETMAAVEEITEAAWQIPYTIRVDSVSNFQHTYAIEDDLIVEDLVQGAAEREASFLEERRDVALAEPLLYERMDIKLFVDAADDVRLMRRIRRDLFERGRSISSILDQYERTVRPMHIEFVEPSKRYADIIVPDGYNHSVVGTITSMIRNFLDDR